MNGRKRIIGFLAWGAVGLLVAGCPPTGPESGGAGTSTFQSADVPKAQVLKVNENFRGKKVAVFAFLNKSLSRYRFLGNASSDYLVEFLQEAGFRTVEGSTSPGMKRVMGELRYGLSDMVSDKSALEAGQHLGTDLVFLGSVTDFNVVKAKGARSVNILGWGVGGGGGSITYSVQAAGRLVDVRTREILAATTSTFRKKFSVKGGLVSTPWGAVRSSEDVRVINETGGRVLQLALNQLMNKVVRRLNSL
ncbi:MAG: CsgG/HfaB family protein [Nitrospinota bacterium]